MHNDLIGDLSQPLPYLMDNIFMPLSPGRGKLMAASQKVGTLVQQNDPTVFMHPGSIGALPVLWLQATGVP